MFVLQGLSPLDVYPNRSDGWETGEAHHASRFCQALNRLRALCDLDDLVRDATVCLAMHRRSGFFAGRLAQTEDAARAFVVPVFQVRDPMLALNRQILL